jgi:pimeloyl-ACP methyl ester carboxylesterase
MHETDLRRSASPGEAVRVAAGNLALEGELVLPAEAAGVVLFAHGSGSSRHSPRNQYVARTIRDAGYGTLLFDLLTPAEEAIDLRTSSLRFDIEFLAHRLIQVTNWVSTRLETCGTIRDGLPFGYFGASSGAAAALVAAARLDERVQAVVSRGGRPDLAGGALSSVRCPTLLIVGEHDHPAIEVNEAAFTRLTCVKDLELVSGATHLFEEPGALEEVARVTARWFRRHLDPAGGNAPLRRSGLWL